jgi:predicted 3-demethylubiquinone-9 3-methyltransferase (glyoxalase superfamily)
MQKITTFLSYPNQAEEAVTLYTKIFPDSTVNSISRYGENMPLPAGTAMVIEFTLNGQPFRAMNGGEWFQFSNGISLSVDCQNQVEVDHYWDKLSEGGEPGPCGWLTDRFGVSWQIVPNVLGRLMTSGTPEQSKRVTAAMMKMGKLEIGVLEAAFAGE